MLWVGSVPGCADRTWFAVKCRRNNLIIYFQSSSKLSAQPKGPINVPLKVLMWPSRRLLRPLGTPSTSNPNGNFLFISTHRYPVVTSTCCRCDYKMLHYHNNASSIDSVHVFSNTSFYPRPDPNSSRPTLHRILLGCTPASSSIKIFARELSAFQFMIPSSRSKYAKIYLQSHDGQL